MILTKTIKIPKIDRTQHKSYEADCAVGNKE